MTMPEADGHIGLKGCWEAEKGLAQAVMHPQSGFRKDGVEKLAMRSSSRRQMREKDGRKENRYLVRPKPFHL